MLRSLLLFLARPFATTLALSLATSLASGAHAETFYAVGDIADCRTVPANKSAAARTATLVPVGAPVIMLGDATYPDGTHEEFENCYRPTWGRHDAKVLPVPGNHEYRTPEAAGFYRYFGDRAGREGYFSTRRGNWLLIGLNSNLAGNALERQEQWLNDVLANEKAECVLAFFHHPFVTSGKRRLGYEPSKRFWKVLSQYRADLVLVGHDHFYEPFEPLDAQGNVTSDGIRQLIVGTGGAPLYDFFQPTPNGSRLREKTYGVLELALENSRYAWRFIDDTGQTRDTGSASCRKK